MPEVPCAARDAVPSSPMRTVDITGMTRMSWSAHATIESIGSQHLSTCKCTKVMSTAHFRAFGGLQISHL